MQLNISLISNGFIVALSTPQQGNQVIFLPNKEAALAMVNKVFEGIQQSPADGGTKENPAPRN